MFFKNLSLFSKKKLFKTLIHLCLLLAVVCVSWGFSGWISFDNGRISSVVPYEEGFTVCSDIAVRDMGCRVSVRIPGAFQIAPDERDRRLLEGTTSLSLSGTPLGIGNNNINGTLEPEKLGQPDLPYAHIQVMIPYSVTMEQLRVTVENADFRPVDGTHEIGPIQQQLFESYYAHVHQDNRVFRKDQKIYSTDAFFTHELKYEIAICHGYKFVNIWYCPVKYNPVSKKLLATNSADIVLTYTQRPVNNMVEPNLFTNAMYRTTIDGITGKRDYQPVTLERGGKFAVVTAKSLLTSQTLKDYIAWRESQGYEHVKTIDGSASASQVTSELKKLHSSETLDFVLVIGDDLVMRVPTDDGKDKYHYKSWARLEGSDEYEDVCLGVFLCNDEAGLKRIINRQKWHEEGGEWTKTFINTAGAEKSENPMARFSSGHYATRNFDKPNGGLGYTVRRVYEVNVVPTKGYGGKFNIPGPYPWEEWVSAQKPFYTSGSQAVNKIYEYWNQGAFMIQHRDHGNITGPSKPAIRMSSSITTKCSPFFLSVNCLSGNFKGNHSRNFAYLTQAKEIGTCATIGAPPVTYSGDNDLYIMGLYAGMFPANGTPPERQLGMAHIYGSKKGQSHSRTYMHNYGDVMTMLSIGDMKPFIKVASPGNGEEVEQKSTCLIQWSDNIDGKVKIELLKAGSVEKTIAASTESDGKFQWNVTEDIAAGNDYKVKIISIDNPALFHISEKTFKIIPEYIIAVFPHAQNLDALDTSTTVLPNKWVQLTDDDLEWTVWAGRTPSKKPENGEATGPDNDHTTGKGNYIYVEASGSNNPSKKATFVTPKFDLNKCKKPVLSFWYHMFSNYEGKDYMGELAVDIAVDGVWKNDIWKMSKNQGDQWHVCNIDLTPYKGDRVILRFRAVTGSGWASDICIDDFAIDEQGTAVTPVVTSLPRVYDLKYYGSVLHYQIPGYSNASYPVSIKLYDLQGKMIKQLIKGVAKPGYYSIRFDSKLKIAAGKYLCRMDGNNFVKTVEILYSK